MEGRKRWLLVLLLFVGGSISYLDRAALSIAAPLIARDLHLDAAGLGIIFSSFFIGYAPLCFVGGYLADRVGPKKVLIASMLIWSLFCGLTATASSLLALVALRIVFGMGEGPFVANINKVVSNWFSRRQQATAIAIANAGMPLGAALAGPVVGFLAVSAGWQKSFVVIAAFGVVWVLVWAYFAQDKPGESAVARDEHAVIDVDSDVSPEMSATPLSHYLLLPSTLATAFAFFGYAYVQFFFLTWFPSYLTMAHGLPIKTMAVATVIPWIGNVSGLIIGGVVSDALFRRTGRAVWARKMVLTTSLSMGAICVALTGTVSGAAGAVALMSAGAFFMATTYNTYFAIVLDTVEKHRVGAIGGFVHFISNLAGIVAPLLTGFLVKWSGNFHAAFMLPGAVAIAGALLVAIFVRAPHANAAGFPREIRA
ncbi:MFS transporter [Burkholderia pyrrocinia]|uniref:MFS transporter n=1 Tax=Burkholderia pyrrocinia TaxID=60550 RepID=UPI002AB1C11E|nr:MFS transporter [Burkholderia pyrrocinia]